MATCPELQVCCYRNSLLQAGKRSSNHFRFAYNARHVDRRFVAGKQRAAIAFDYFIRLQNDQTHQPSTVGFRIQSERQGCCCSGMSRPMRGRINLAALALIRFFPSRTRVLLSTSKPRLECQRYPQLQDRITVERSNGHSEQLREVSQKAAILGRRPSPVRSTYGRQQHRSGSSTLHRSTRFLR